MIYERWSDFLDDWGDPDFHNFLVSWCQDGCGIEMEIFKPRKQAVEEVTVRYANIEQAHDWAKKSVEVLKENLSIKEIAKVLEDTKI